MPHPIDRIITSIRQISLYRMNSNNSAPASEEAPQLNKNDLMTISSDPVMTEAFCSRLSREIQDPDGPELIPTIIEHMIIDARSDLASLQDKRDMLHNYLALPSLASFGGAVTTFLIGNVATGFVPIFGAVALLIGSALSTGIAVYGRHILNKRILKTSSEVARLEFLIKRLNKKPPGGPNGTV